MAGGQFYTVLMQQTNKRLATRLQLGKMKEKQKVRAITRYRQREVLFTGYVGCGKSALLRAVVHHYTLPTCSLHHNGEIVMFMGVGKGKPKGSYPAKFVLVDSSGYNEEHGGVVRFLLNYRPNLRMVFLMIDASKGLQDQDRSMLKYIDNITLLRSHVQPVLTKVDLIPPEERPKIAEQIFEEIKKTSPWAPAPILTCSRKEGQMGIEEIRRCIAQAAGLPYEEAWVARNGPRPKPKPLADATNEQDGDVDGDAEHSVVEAKPTARPARPPKPERRRMERAERPEWDASRGRRENRPDASNPPWAQRGRQRQAQHTKPDQAEARRPERRDTEGPRSRQQAHGFGLKSVSKEASQS